MRAIKRKIVTFSSLLSLIDRTGGRYSERSGTGRRGEDQAERGFLLQYKLLLIFMVVYGHLLEGIMDNAEPLMQIYRIIYSVHMPLFLSGLFLKSVAFVVSVKLRVYGWAGMVLVCSGGALAAA